MRLPFPPFSHCHCHKLQLTSFPFFPEIIPAGKRPCWPRMDSAANIPLRRHRRKDKIIVIMGATGTGKSRLSVDLASSFSSEIINCDKMQVYKGLDITTNKIQLSERRGVPHHLLGDVNPAAGDLSPSDFRSLATSTISNIISRRKLPLIVGGSNSFIHALVVDGFDSSQSDLFTGSHFISNEFRYNCCFIWVDVSLIVLTEYLRKRVDDMLNLGMFDELVDFYKSESNESLAGTGLRKAIGVPEFDRYIGKYQPPDLEQGKNEVRMEEYKEAVRMIKENTCRLAKKQVGKILHLRGSGWNLRRVDATEVFRAEVTSEAGVKRTSEVWEREVVEPSMKIVKRFLEE